MKEGVAEKKVPGGKFVRVKAYLTNECKVTNIVIEGDFFAYPPDAVDELGHRVRGAFMKDALSVSRDVLKGISFGGVDSETLLTLIEAALQKACGDGE